LRNPVVVIPGLLGTRLVDPDTGQVVWGAFGGGAASPKTPEGMRLLALPLIGSYASSYQLLPRPRHGAVVWEDTGEPMRDLYDPDLWSRLRWGLAAPESEAFLATVLPEELPARRREIASKYQAKQLKRARHLAAALDLPAEPPEEIQLMLVAGDAVDTAQTIAVNRQTGAIQVRKRGAGDGTVLRTSALGDERPGQAWSPMATTPIAWSQVLFLFSDHLGLTKDPAFSDNVLYWLLEDPRASIMPMPVSSSATP